MKMSRPFRLRNCCEIVQPLRGAELLNREVQQERLESSMVVVRVLTFLKYSTAFLPVESTLPKKIFAR